VNAKREEQEAAAAADAASTALKHAVGVHARLLEQRSHVTAAADAHASLVREEEQLERDITATRSDVNRLRGEAEQGRAFLLASREAFDGELRHFANVAPDIDRLTAELQALIQTESDCPLCGSNFGSPSALARAIALHAERRTVTFDALRQTLEKRRRERDRLEGAAGRAEVALTGAAARLATREANRSRVVASRENAAELLPRLTNGRDVAQTLADLSASISTALVRVEELRRSATDISARLATARETLRNADVRATSAASALENAARTSASLESAVRRAPSELGVRLDVEAISQIVSRLTEELRTDLETVAVQARRVRGIADALTRVSDELASAEARHAIEQQRLHEAIRHREARTQQLAVLSLPATASRIDIERAAVTAQERHTHLRDLASMMSELVDIANSATMTDLGFAEQELANYDHDLRECERELKALTSVGTTLNKWEDSLRKRVEAAVREFVFPREAEIENTFLSLVADPFRFERIAVDHDASHGLRLGLVFRSLSEPSGSPEFFLSAAQMSALALSIFLSLARSQTWSWLDTILLDDPVQHLDDLDCIALLDGLRNVARQSRSKQLIISTCDRSLYHHMIRKFSMGSAPANSTLLAIRLEEDLSNGVRLQYEVDSRRGGPHSAAVTSRSR
jgi:exonuclease SbcC